MILAALIGAALSAAGGAAAECAGALAKPEAAAPGATPGEGGMAERQMEAFSAMMAAVNDGNAAKYARLYAPDAVITIPGGAPLTGRSAIEQHEVALLTQFPGTRLGFSDVWQKGALAVVHYAVNGRTPAGQPMGHEGLLFYRFEPSGLIAEERRYMDSLTPMAQLGALGPGPARALPMMPVAMQAHAASGSAEERRNVERARASLAALDGRDEAAFLAGLAEDVVLDDLTDLQPLHGKPAVKGWFAKWTRALPDARSEIISILGVGDAVLVEMVVRGTLRGPLGRLTPTDKPIVAHRAAIFQVGDGAIARLAWFVNGKEIAEAAGQWPPRAGK